MPSNSSTVHRHATSTLEEVFVKTAETAQKARSAEEANAVQQ